MLDNVLLGMRAFARESILRNLFAARSVRREERADRLRAEEILERFNLADLRYDRAETLSGGQKRLVEIMRALMLRPRLLLLDEPMSGVHPSIVNEIAGYLEQLRDDGLTILMVEHELHIVDRLCDPVIVMAQGKVIGQGTMAALRRQPEVVEAYLVG